MAQKSTEHTEIVVRSKMVESDLVFGSLINHAKSDNTKMIERISKPIQIQKFLNVFGARLLAL